MANYMGFYMVPRLSNSDVDSHEWKAFLDQVEQKYKQDKVFSKTNESLEFHVGENLRLAIDPELFTIFSSKVTGSCKTAEPYINEVFEIAKMIFGPRVRFWSEVDRNEHIVWDEIDGVIN